MCRRPIQILIVYKNTIVLHGLAPARFRASPYDRGPDDTARGGSWHPPQTQPKGVPNVTCKTKPIVACLLAALVPLGAAAFVALGSAARGPDRPGSLQAEMVPAVQRRTISTAAPTPALPTQPTSEGRPEDDSRNTTAPAASLDGIRLALANRDWSSFRQYVDEESLVESFLEKVDKQGLKAPNGQLILEPGLGPAARALIARIALATLRRVVRGEAIAKGVNGAALDRALDSVTVEKIRTSGRVARVTLAGGPMKRAVLKMTLVDGRWRVVEIEDYGAF